MHPFSLLPRCSRWLSVLVCLLGCGLALSAQTTLTGTVYAPNGGSNLNPDPMPNVLVFVAPAGTLPDINHGGVGVTGGCSAQQDLVGVKPVVYTTTDYKGNFTLTGPALDALGSGPVNLVIQAGKWRRQFPNTNVVTGTANPVGDLYMPADASQGDLPRIAIVTGSADSIECVISQMGINNSEVTSTAGTGHVNLFQGTQSPGAAASANSTDTEASLMTNSTLLDSYDMVMLGCQGTYRDATVTGSKTGLNNLRSYADAGGRVFATHYEYVWLDKPETFASAAEWRPDENSITPNGGTGTITLDQSTPEGQTLAQWLYYIGASTVIGKLPDVHNLRQDQSGINTPPTQSWGTLDPPYSSNTLNPPPIMQFSFDTPIQTSSSSNDATISLAFSNSPQDFVVGDAADNVTLTITNTSTVPVNGLTVTFALPSLFTAVSGSLQGSGWSCNTPTLTCSETAYLDPGANTQITFQVAVASSGAPGKKSVSASVSGVGLTTGNAQCGRVLFNEYHVESGSRSTEIYPNECPKAASSFTPPEKFLEFSLYNLTNFISPSNTLTVLVQAPTHSTWAQPSTIYYGHPLDGSVLDAQADTPGTFTYTPAAGTVLNPGTYTLDASFTPTGTDYLPSSVSTQLTVLPDPTVSTINNLDQTIYYGQEIGYDNGVDAVLNVAVQSPPGYPVGVKGGTFVATVDGAIECTGTEGTPITGGTRSGACPDSGFLGWNAGTHSMQLTYEGSTDFLPSRSAAYPVVILPDPTATSLTSSVSSAVVGSAISFNTTVGDAYTTAVGSVVFYDVPVAVPAATASAGGLMPLPTGATAIGSAAVGAAGTASLNLSNLFVGTHYIVACFKAGVNSSGTYNFLNSCSASVTELISKTAAGPLNTVTMLASSANPSAVGQSVSFTATVQTTGAFVGMPTGSVTFYDGSTSLGSVALTSSGTAVLTTSALAVGSHSITAVYAGSSTMATSTSAVLTQLVEQSLTLAPNSFLLLVTPTTVPVYVGSSAVVTVQIVDLTNFNQPVSLSCGGLPSEATCHFAETTVPAGGGTTQLLVSPAAPHDCGSSVPYFASFGGRGMLSLLGVSTLVLCFSRRRKLQGIALVVMLCAIPAALSGCGTGNCTDFGVKPGDYSFTLVATAGTTPIAVTSSSSIKVSDTTKVQAMVMHVHL